MEFPTLDFAAFALLTLTVAWWVRRYRTIQKLFLLTVSYAFAWKWRPLFLAVIVGSSLFNYIIGRTLHRLPDDHKSRRSVLVFGVVSNLALLGFFKYYGFFVDNLGNLLGWLGLEAHLPLLEILAPFAISFYTFQGISYIVDTYRRKAVQPRTLLDFLLFIAFFPQLGAGPICRSHQFLPQIHEPAPDQVQEPSRAFVLIITGLFKKMVLASYFATNLTTDAFLAPNNYSSAELILAVYAYTAQVYVDFSGYTDLARGVGLLFGFRLPENFNYPYAATDIGDFWRRWHITFSTWLREYIYFPLGGSRVGRWRTYFNLMVTFTACGIWHGASWGYIIWGGLHGLGLSVYKASVDIRRDMGIDLKAPSSWWWLAMGWMTTLSFCAFTRIFFKAPDLSTAGEMWAGIFTSSSTGQGFELGVLCATLLVLAMNFIGRPTFNALIRAHDALPNPLRPFAWVGAFLVLFMLKPYGMAATIYFQF